MTKDKSPSEFAELMKTAEVEVVRLGVDASEYGPGYLEIKNTTFKDGGGFISPAFYPDSAKTYTEKGEVKKFHEGVNAPKGGFPDGAAAIRAMRNRYGLIFKVKKFNTI